MAPLIEVREAKKVYKVGSVAIHALNGLSLSIPTGEICAVIGRSGSGKSTLLNVMVGLEPVTSGEIVIANLHLERMTQSELILFRQKHVGFVFQSFNLMPYYTALENVALPLTFMGISASKRTRMAREALLAMGLKSHMDHKPSQLSGGQQQRVGIARALVSDPKLVFADEPTGNLDSKTSDEVMTAICSAVRERGKTMVMVTHDSHVAEYADRSVDILDGKITGMYYHSASEAKNED